MSRFEDSPGLFGESVGNGTLAAFTCGCCGHPYPELAGDDDDVHFVEFAGMRIGECCFEVMENAVLAEMHNILPWFIKILQGREKRNEGFKKLVEELKKTL